MKILNSLKVRLTIALLLIVLVPIIGVTWYSSSLMFDMIRQERMKDVGQMATTRHSQLGQYLNRQTIRAQGFLSGMGTQCGTGGGKQYHDCIEAFLRSYMATESATGAILHNESTGEKLSVGVSATQSTRELNFKAGQLAQFSATGRVSNRSYFIGVWSGQTGSRLVVTYPASVLDAIFSRPKELGLSGETFLTDGEGYFVTQARYHSTQGHDASISTRPMQACLSGQSAEVLDIDYRNVPIIRGFNFVPEFGSACIMAHFDQEEAFAPLQLLKQRIVYATLLLVLLLIVTAIYLVRKIVKPVTRITDAARAISAGDYNVQVQVGGADELAELATNFNHMTHKLLSESQGFLQNEARLTAILDNVLDGIITINERGEVESFNKSAVKIFGYQPAEVIGHNVKMLMPEPYHSQHDGYLHNFTTTGHKKIIGIGREVVGQRRDGSTFPMDLAVSEMHLGDKRMFTGIVRDISERKKRETEFYNISRLSQAVVDGADHMIITADIHGLILSFNHAAEQKLGYRAEELVGKSSPAVFHDLNEVVQRAQQLTDAGMPVEPGFEVFVLRARTQSADTQEWIYVRKDGTHFPVSLTISALRDGNGEINAFLGVATDITERVKIEQMKDEFISTVSHELRTPLTSIRGALGLVAGGAMGEVPQQAKVLVDIAYANSERLILLVNDILDMEKIEAGKMEFQCQATSLLPLLQQSMESNQAYAAQFQVAYEIASGLADVTINVDPNRMMQVLSNLMSNAAKFSKPGDKVLIDTSMHGACIRISITDFGLGICNEFKDRIFQKFSQADGSDTRKKGGTGLGLSITKAIVNAMGGSIGFDSVPDVKTTFHIEFPVVNEANAAGSDEVWQDERKRVLICEDDRDIAMLLGLMMGQIGLEADVAYSAAQAKQLLGQHSYAVMTVDLGLPDQDGIGLIRELRENVATARLPILVVSAKADQGRKELNGEAFMVADWISKPIDQDRLEKSLRLALAQADRRPRVLHVEDDTDILQVVRFIVGGFADISSAGTLREAQQMLQNAHFDLAILDIGLPDGSGLELLSALNGATPPIPVMIFSAQELGNEHLRLVRQALLKSRTDNSQLRDSIKRLVGIK